MLRAGFQHFDRENISRWREPAAVDCSRNINILLTSRVGSDILSAKSFTQSEHNSRILSIYLHQEHILMGQQLITFCGQRQIKIQSIQQINISIYRSRRQVKKSRTAIVHPSKLEHFVENKYLSISQLITFDSISNCICNLDSTLKSIINWYFTNTFMCQSTEKKF